MAGLLHVFTTSTGARSLGYTTASASFYDTIHFLAPAGSAGNTVEITETLWVSGSAAGNGIGSTYWYGFVSDPSSQNFQQYRLRPTPGPSNFAVEFKRSLPVVNGEVVDVLTIGVSADPSCSGCTDTLYFSHTATVTQTLLTGWTFASESGRFLQAPIPEPATYAMMFACLAVLRVAATRRRKLTQQA